MTQWLFLRGLSREARHWLPFPTVFEAIVPGARVHVLDLPGAGTEWRRRAPLTVAEVADDVRGRWLRLPEARTQRWALLGMSLGGMVALQWAGAFSSDFECAVVINTSASDLALPWERMRVGVLPGLSRAFRGKDAVSREREILGATTRIFSAIDTRAARWAEYHRERPMTRSNVLRQLASASRFRSPPRIDVPLLVLAAAHDPLASPESSRRIAAKYGARFELHPAAGHDLPLDDPAWVAERVATFVRGDSRARGLDLRQ